MQNQRPRLADQRSGVNFSGSTQHASARAPRLVEHVKKSAAAVWRENGPRARVVGGQRFMSRHDGWHTEISLLHAIVVPSALLPILSYPLLPPTARSSFLAHHIHARRPGTKGERTTATTCLLALNLDIPGVSLFPRALYREFFTGAGYNN